MFDCIIGNNNESVVVVLWGDSCDEDMVVPDYNFVVFFVCDVDGCTWLFNDFNCMFDNDLGKLLDVVQDGSGLMFCIVA
jgi:hypothetical protein